MKLKFAINGLLIAVLYNSGEIIILTPLIVTNKLKLFNNMANLKA